MRFTGSMENAIAVEDLRVRYRGAGREAVAGISFEVAGGEVLGFLGPNGAGKSTTQQVLTGQLAYQGRVEVLGRSPAEWGPDLYTRIGVGFELPANFPKLTGRENLAAFAGLHSGGTVRSPLEALDLVGLASVADQRVGTYSKGMRVRLNLARALLHRPDVLFLDEPTAGLDPTHAAQVHEVIRAQAHAGCTVFLTTHDMTTVDELCDRVAFLLDGRISLIDTPRALRLAHGQARVRVEYRDDGALRQAEFPLTAPTDTALLSLLRDARVETIHTREATLRDVFIAVTGGRL
jgi:fluoroquinolone transport system ATP-binding protein